MTYRTGNHWGVTIVRQDLPPDANGDHADLVAVVVNGDRELAERICALLNGDGAHVRPVWDTWDRGYKDAYDALASVTDDAENAPAARKAARWAVDYLAAGVTGKQAMEAGAPTAEACGAFTNTYGEREDAPSTPHTPDVDHARGAAEGWNQAINVLVDVATRTDSPAAGWAAAYLTSDPDRLGPREDAPSVSPSAPLAAEQPSVGGSGRPGPHGGAETVKRLTDALANLIDPDPCHFDHSGDCQAHFAMVGGHCAQATAKELLAEQKADQP